MQDDDCVMKNTESILSRIEIAKPCKADWESMTGDERERACQLCRLNVYNISTMTTKEAESFLQERLPQGRVCVRLYRRFDGTIITDNCPKGLRAARDAAKQIVRRVAAAASLLLAFLVGAPSQSQSGGTCDKNQPADVKLMGKPVARLMGEPTAIQGDVAQPVSVMGAPAPMTGLVRPPRVNMTPYMDAMEAKIAKAWKLPAGNDSLKVRFKIQNDGSVTDLKIDRSSGHAKLDKAAIAAVKGASPFGKLPPLSQPTVDAEYTFR
jgi:TonB family protein